MTKKTKRKAFNFLRSYFDVLNELKADSDKLGFLMSIINKQFLDEDPKDLDFLVKLCYESQRHSVETSVKGWKRASCTDMEGNSMTNPPTIIGSNPPSDPKEEEEEEEVEEEEKGQVQEEGKVELLIYPTFEDFWNTYDKKSGNRIKSEKLWASLNQDVKEIIIDHSCSYVFSTPEKQYRKNPEVYLSQQHWNNEILIPQKNGKQKGFNKIRPEEFSSFINKGR